MIRIDALPCKGCKNYKGIVKPDGTEKTEYVKCVIAKEKNAKNMLKGLHTECDGYNKDEKHSF